MKKSTKIIIISVSLVVVLALSFVLLWLFVFNDKSGDAIEFKDSMLTNVLSVEINKDTQDVLTEDILFTPAKRTSDIYVRYKVIYENDDSTSLAARDLQKSAGLKTFTTTDASHPNYGLKWVNVGEYYYLCGADGVPKVLTKQDYKNEKEAQFVFLAKDGLKKSELITADMFTEERSKVVIKLVAESVLADGMNAEYKADGTIIEGQDGIVDSPADIANKFVDKYPAETIKWTFKVQGQPDKVVEVAYGENVVAPILNPAEYDFAGWNTQANGSGMTISESDLKSVSESKTVYAIIRSKFSLTFNANGGEGKDKNQVAYISEGNKLDANTFTREGYEFLGWATNKNATEAEFGDQVAVEEVSTTPGENITLYAVWEIDTYTIKLNGNKATSGTLADIVYAMFDETVLTENAFQRTGYTFLGWSTSATATSATYLDKASIATIIADLEAVDGDVITLYAVWKENAYTIKFNANTATGEMANLPTKYDDAIRLSANAFTKEGYHFLGWATTADATKAEIANKAVISKLSSVDGDIITLYAVWEINTYTIKFNGNNSTSGTLADINYSHFEEKDLTANTFARTGYTYLGWATTADATEAKYLDGASVTIILSELSAKHGDVVTLYAVWKEHTYTIKFDANSAIGEMANVQTKYDNQTKLPANTFLKEGYHFAGWALTKDATEAAYADKEIVSKLSEADGAEITLYAVWEIKTYTIRLNGNKATSGTISDIIYTHFEERDLTANTFARTGYTYLGWATSASATEVRFVDEASIKAIISELNAKHGDVITLYAVWKEHSYTIKFDANTATGEMANVQTKYDDQTKLPTNTFLKEGYHLAGWALTADATEALYKDESLVSKLSSVDGSEITLYAVWKINSYTIKFVGKNATSGTLADINYSHFEDKNLPANTFERTGYTYLGWTTSSTSNVVEYNDQASIANIILELGAKHGDVITLYTAWEEHSYTIKFDANGGVGTLEDIQTKYDDNTSLHKNIFTRDHYTFLGWSTNKNATAPDYTEGVSIFNTVIPAKVSKLTAENNGVVTIYAIWRANTYSLKINYKSANVAQSAKLSILGYGFQTGVIGVGESFTITHTYDGTTLPATFIAGYDLNGKYVIGTASGLTIFSHRLTSGIENCYQIAWDGKRNKEINLYVAQVCTINISSSIDEDLKGNCSLYLSAEQNLTSREAIYGETVPLEINLKSALAKRITLTWEWNSPIYHSTHTVTVESDHVDSKFVGSDSGWVTIKGGQRTGKVTITTTVQDPSAQLNIYIYDGPRQF